MPSLITRQAPASPPPSPRVAFKEEVVAGISRPMTNEEHWVLYNFEMHARECDSCKDPRRIQRHGKQLCPTGLAYAKEVASALYSSRSGTIYSTQRDNGNHVRVEIPSGFIEAEDLMKAIERSIRHKEHFITRPERKIIERAPSVKKPGEKVYNRDGKIERTHSTRKSKDYHTSKHEKTIVEWPEERVRPQRRPTIKIETAESEVRTTKNHQYPVIIDNSRTGAVAERQVYEKKPTPTVESVPEIIVESNHSKRGSLYMNDMAELKKREQREKKINYKLEERVPSNLAHKERRKVYPANDRYHY